MRSFEEAKWSAFTLAGEGFDLVAAPLLAYWIYKLHGSGVGAVIGFCEELGPFTDIIPTATGIWIYRYVLNAEATAAEHRRQFGS